MGSRSQVWLAILVLLGTAVGATAAPAARETSPGEVARTIDRLLAARWAVNKFQPVAPASDAEFLRRVSLDLIGTIPSVGEVRAFLDDPASDKRRRLVERLLNSPAYATHFARTWRAAWLPDVNDQLLPPQQRTQFENWVRARLRENAAYDEMVREILTLAPAPRGAAMPGLSPVAFQQANENKPENLAASTSRLFLGMRLECAQCHNHFFAKWTREQFWQLAAFFAPPRSGGNRHEIAIPGANKIVKAGFPDGREPDFKKNPTARVVLADWITDPANKYFARAAVNRVWAHFFSIGLTDPVDDIPEAVNDEILATLAREFAEHRFDLKFLIRVIVETRAYQLSSAGSRDGPDAAAHFARMSVKGLSPEQVLASLAEATGIGDGSASARAELLASFGRESSGRPGTPSIPQALALMNGKVVNDSSSLEQSGTLSAVANAPFLDSAGRIETLYLAALGRPPTTKETSRLVRYVEKGGPSKDSKRALADVFWALLNSSEFILNH